MDFCKEMVVAKALGSKHRYLINKPVSGEWGTSVLVANIDRDFDDDATERFTIEELTKFIDELNDALDQARIMEEKNYENG